MSESNKLEEVRARRGAIQPQPLVQDGLQLFTRFVGNDPKAITEFITRAPEDIDWLIAEVERLRQELAPCGEPGCPHAHAVPTRRAEGRSTL